MRFPATLLALTIAAPAAAADPGSQGAHLAPPREQASTSNCRTTRSYRADRSPATRDGRMIPRKLSELPPGITYMAVYRHIGDCEAPLTMAKYRGGLQH